MSFDSGAGFEAVAVVVTCRMPCLVVNIIVRGSICPNTAPQHLHIFEGRMPSWRDNSNPADNIINATFQLSWPRRYSCSILQLHTTNILTMEPRLNTGTCIHNSLRLLLWSHFDGNILYTHKNKSIYRLQGSAELSSVNGNFGNWFWFSRCSAWLGRGRAHGD